MKFPWYSIFSSGINRIFGLIPPFILQSVHLLYKYAIRINVCFIRSMQINFSAYEYIFKPTNNFLSPATTFLCFYSPVKEVQYEP